MNKKDASATAPSEVAGDMGITAESGLTAEPSLPIGVQRAGAVCLSALERMQQIQERLEAIRLLLRQDQPKKDGVILLELANCGKGCLGCPHVRWKQWRWHENRTRHQWQAHPIPYPLKKLRHTGVFTASAPMAVSRIREALVLDEERGRLVQRLHDLRRTLGVHGPVHA